MFEVLDLACERGGRRVFEGVTFRLEAGGALVLRGANGSGKSSLLRLLAGLLTPAAGRIAWRGEEAARAAPFRHYVGHADGLKARLSVRENLVFAAGLLGASGSSGNNSPSGEGDDAGPALAAFDLARLAGQPARVLSSGQRRRLALARLLLGRRPLWLLDEPAVGLDAANRARLEGLLDRHRGQGGLLVVASHGDVRVPGAAVLDFGA